MKKDAVHAKRSQSASLVALETTLQDAKLSPSPEMRTYRAEVDEQQLVSLLIENVKKEHKSVSPFVNWMGQLFPDEYKEMVAADVRG